MLILQIQCRHSLSINNSEQTPGSKGHQSPSLPVAVRMSILIGQAIYARERLVFQIGSAVLLRTPNRLSPNHFTQPQEPHLVNCLYVTLPWPSLVEDARPRFRAPELPCAVTLATERLILPTWISSKSTFLPPPYLQLPRSSSQKQLRRLKYRLNICSSSTNSHPENRESER